MDGFYNTPLPLPEDERVDWVEYLLAKPPRIMEKGIDPEEEIPLDRLEAEFLIGLSFRLVEMEVIHSSQTHHDLEVLQTELANMSRANAYREISEYSFLEYFYAFV